MKKKLLGLIVAAVMAIGIIVPVAFAAPKVPDPEAYIGDRIEANVLNAGFHCNTFGGNGRVWVKAYDDKYEAAKKAKDKGVWEDFIYIGDNAWLLDTDEYECPNCGSKQWLSYSNKSGVPDGKNIQLTHYVPPPPPEEDDEEGGFSGDERLFIEKHLEGGLISVDYDLWLQGDVSFEEIIASMFFFIFEVDYFGADLPDEPLVIAQLELDGSIYFEQIPAGWYAIKEVLTGPSAELFKEVPPVYFQIGTEGIVGSSSVASSFDPTGAYCLDTDTTFPFGRIIDPDEEFILNYHVKNQTTGEVFFSFCADFLSGTDNCVGLTNQADNRFANDPALKADIIKAFNYINDTWGSLDQWPKEPNNPEMWYGQYKYSDPNGDSRPDLATKVIAQIVLWALLNDGEVDFVISEEWGEDRMIAKSINDAVAETIANYKNHEGGSVIDLAFFALDTYEYGVWTNSQPQLVPIFAGGDIVFENFFDDEEEQKSEGTIFVSLDVAASYDEVTYARNPIYNSTGSDTVVSKSIAAYTFGNGMTYVAVDVAAATDGVVRIELADSSPSNRGAGIFYNVTIADGKLTVSFDEGVTIPAESIGILLSATKFASRPTSEMKHDNVLTKALPAGVGDTVYLYLHSAGGIVDTNEIIGWGNKEYVFSRVSVDCDYEGAVTVLIMDAEGNVVFDGKFDVFGSFESLLGTFDAGVYTYKISGEWFAEDFVGEVEVTAGNDAGIELGTVSVKLTNAEVSFRPWSIV